MKARIFYIGRLLKRFDFWSAASAVFDMVRSLNRRNNVMIGHLC